MTGSELMKEKAFRVGHIFNFPVEDINKESARLVHEHATKWPNEVCHMQKHSLFAIPVNEIVYDIDGEVNINHFVYFKRYTFFYLKVLE